MLYYLGVSANTKTKVSSYAIKVEEKPTLLEIESFRDCSSPRALLLGLTKILENDDSYYVIIVNSSFLVDALMEGTLWDWRDSGWFKQSGEEVANKDVWADIVTRVDSLLENGSKLLVRFPETSLEKSKHKLCCNIAKNKRKAIV